MAKTGTMSSSQICKPMTYLFTLTKRLRRSITLRPEAQYKALVKARKRAQTADYQADYALRAGVEGTMSEGVRAHGLRRARDIV